MAATHFTYKSADKITDIHAIEWTPDGEITGIVQLVHGMQEFIDRYDDFACFLNTKGFLVVGNDHLGHGSSVSSEDKFGYFAEKDGNKAVIADMRRLQRLTQEKYPDVPYFMFGHSMGSFLARQYVCMYARHLDGAIISGTGYYSAATCDSARMLCTAISKVKGMSYRSHRMNDLVLGGLNKRFEPARTHVDWLTRDEAVVDAYRADPRTHHMFTLNAYYNMFTGLKYLTNRSNLEKIPFTFPMLFVAGEMDPVGDFGRGVKKVVMELKNVGLKDVDCILYPNDRHEVINELNKAEVYNDIFNWLERHMPRA